MEVLPCRLGPVVHVAALHPVVDDDADARGVARRLGFRRRHPRTGTFDEGEAVPTHNNAKGIVRAYDVKTGELRWSFNTIPGPGELPE